MAKFIEVTGASDGVKRFINLAWVEEIVEDMAGTTTIYFAFNCPNSIDQDYMRVMESYEEIKRMVTEGG